MKKIFFSLVAIAALAACSKSEVEFEQTGEITLAPVTSNTTKSVAGFTDAGVFDGVFPTAIDIYVFANAGQPGSAANAHTEPYFRNAQFEWFTTAQKPNATNNTAAGGAYAGTTTRYWPNVKTLVFAGYSDACGLSKTTPTMNFTTDVLTIPAYTQDNATYKGEGENDLMWFPSTTPYSKQTGEIVANMKHTCSWLTINVAGDAVTSNNWKLNSLVVKGIAHTGTATCDAEKAIWDITGQTKTDEDYYNPQSGDFNPATGTTFTTTATEYYKSAANNFIVIPQEPTTLEVTYSYNSDTDIVFSETKSISLDYDGVDGTNAVWKSGVHYIYNLTITATEILIDPVVVEWTESVYDADKDETGDQPIEI